MAHRCLHDAEAGPARFEGDLRVEGCRSGDKRLGRLEDLAAKDLEPAVEVAKPQPERDAHHEVVHAADQ